MIARLTAAAAAGLAVALACAAPAAADPVREAQWHLGFLDVARAHEISQGEGVVVAVIDTGVDAGHPDLQESVLDGVDLSIEGPGDGQQDTDGHGTGMAGLIAAHGRALGIAPEATILPIRKATGLAVDLHDNSASAFEWAIAHGAQVICFAAGTAERDPFLEEAVGRALAADIVVVAGAGNAPDSVSIAYPAAYPGVIAAVGVDRQGGHAEVSVTGRQAVLAAPAVDVVSTDIRTAGRSGYRSGTGTSDATAIIAGAAALVRSRFPELSAAEVVHRLTATADDKGPPGRDPEYGFGIVNPVRALTADVPPLTPTSTPEVATVTITDPPADDDGSTLGTAAVIGALALAAIIGATLTTLAVRRRNES